MASTRLRVGALLALATSAAATTCDEERARIGVAVEARDGRVRVATVDAAAPAGPAGLRPGDEIVQVNAVLPRSCGEWARAVRVARDDETALLLLVRRDGSEQPLVIAARAWRPPDEPAAATADTRTPRPAAPAAPPPPPPLPPDVAVSVEGVVGDLETLAGGVERRASLVAYRKEVRGVRRAIETLGARGAVTEDVLGRLRRIVRHYEAAEVAWESEEALRERDRRPRHVPLPEEAPAPWFEESSVGAILEEFPFLRETVTKDPDTEGFVRASGTWQPVRARHLLWVHAARELAGLR